MVNSGWRVKAFTIQTIMARELKRDFSDYSVILYNKVETSDAVTVGEHTRHRQTLPPRTND